MLYLLIPALRGVRQEDCYKLKAGLSYITNTRPTRTTQQDVVSRREIILTRVPMGRGGRLIRERSILAQSSLINQYSSKYRGKRHLQHIASVYTFISIYRFYINQYNFSRETIEM